MSSPINNFDAIVIGILVLSAMIAFYRGFIRELLSLGAWVGAGILTVYLFPHSTQLLKHHVKGDLAAGIAALGTYIAALIAITLLNSIILRYVKKGSEVGLLDNFLGLIFGVLRGAFILSLGYLIMSATIPKDPPPTWIKGSMTRPYLQTGADALTAAAPKYLGEFEALVKRQEDDYKKDKAADEGDTKTPGDKIDMNFPYVHPTTPAAPSSATPPTTDTPSAP